MQITIVFSRIYLVSGQLLRLLNFSLVFSIDMKELCHEASVKLYRLIRQALNGSFDILIAQNNGNLVFKLLYIC